MRSRFSATQTAAVLLLARNAGLHAAQQECCVGPSDEQAAHLHRSVIAMQSRMRRESQQARERSLLDYNESISTHLGRWRGVDRRWGALRRGTCSLHHLFFSSSVLALLPWNMGTPGLPSWRLTACKGTGGPWQASSEDSQAGRLLPSSSVLALLPWNIGTPGLPSWRLTACKGTGGPWQASSEDSQAGRLLPSSSVLALLPWNIGTPGLPSWRLTACKGTGGPWQASSEDSQAGRLLPGSRLPQLYTPGGVVTPR